jgi:Glycosyl transferase family 2
VDVSVVVPIRCDPCDGHERLTRSLEGLRAAGAEIIVADGSPATPLGRHRRSFAGLRHIAVVPRPGTNGKVAGVHAGVYAATRERVVLADDDVLYDTATLTELARRLEEADVVVPQNVFIGPHRWHTIWDTGRILVNRAFGHDYAGTMAVRRSSFVAVGGYDDTALFENLELIRTIRAGGGRVRWADDVYVPRSPPDVDTFLHQRVRQAYDDLAQPPRLIAEASILPVCILLASSRYRAALAVFALGVMGWAEVGRRRAGGRAHFPAITSIAALMWVIERAICVWVAVAARVFRGGARYRGGRLRKAASSPRALLPRGRRLSVQPHAHHHRAASPWNGRIGTRARSSDGSP